MEKIEKIKEFVSQIHQNNKDGHGFDHISRVVALAGQILVSEPDADAELVIATAYLHDTYDEKICADVESRKLEVADFLENIGFSQKKIEQIFYIIDNMSFSSNLLEKKLLDLNGQIVQDADRLDAMGAWGIVRTLEYGWAKERVLYDPEVEPAIYASKSDYHQQDKNTTINHFYEKLFLLKDLLNRPKAKEIGAVRDQIMHDFVGAIEDEYGKTMG